MRNRWVWVLIAVLAVVLTVQAGVWGLKYANQMLISADDAIDETYDADYDDLIVECDSGNCGISVQSDAQTGMYFMYGDGSTDYATFTQTNDNWDSYIGTGGGSSFNWSVDTTADVFTLGASIVNIKTSFQATLGGVFTNGIQIDDGATNAYRIKATGTTTGNLMYEIDDSGVHHFANGSGGSYDVELKRNAAGSLSLQNPGGNTSLIVMEDTAGACWSCGPAVSTGTFTCATITCP